MSRIKQAIQEWWSTRPMTYGAVHGQPTYLTGAGSAETLSFRTREFFQRLDQTFYSWTRPLHSEIGFFAKIFPYDRYHGKDVLEIGCGLGTMAMNWALHGARVTAIDLSPFAVAQTARRFRIFGLDGLILEADAHSLPFPDRAFQYVYSWGVLHHSPDLPRSVTELFRVLQPGGEFGVMLYHRQSIFYGYFIRYLEGFVHAESRFLDPLQLASRYTDGADQEGNPYTWPVTRREAREIFAPYSANLTIQLGGQELDSTFQLMFPGIGDHLPGFLQKPWARRWGWSLWISGTKRTMARSNGESRA